MEVRRDDIELLQNYRSTGNTEVLGELYGRYIHLVYGVCLKYLKDREQARDAVMDIFEALVNKARTHEVRNFKSWLHVLTKNHCLMLIRSSRYRSEQQAVEIREIHMETDHILHHENGQGLESDLSALRECMDKLHGEQRICVEMFYIQERSYREIAENTRFELKKVKSHIQNGKRNLKICMENKSEKAR